MISGMKNIFIPVPIALSSGRKPWNHCCLKALSASGLKRIRMTEAGELSSDTSFQFDNSNNII